MIRNQTIRSYISSWDSRLIKIRNYEDYVKGLNTKYDTFLSDFIDFSNEKDGVSIIVSDKRPQFLSSRKLRNHLYGIGVYSYTLNGFYLEEKTY